MRLVAVALLFGLDIAASAAMAAGAGRADLVNAGSWLPSVRTVIEEAGSSDARRGVSESLVVPVHESAPVDTLNAGQEGVVRAIETLIEAMRRADSTMAASVLHPDLVLNTVAVRPGLDGEGRAWEPMLRSTPAQGFLQAVGAPREEVWDERISNVDVRIDGPLASAWMEYSFYRGEQFSHCGVNTMSLILGSDGWKIFSISDTRRRDGCGV